MRINKTAFLKYYNLGYSDTHISKILKCTPGGVSGYRRKLRLPAHFKIDYPTFIKYYNLGYSDTKIAELLGCSKMNVGNYRRKLGLRSHNFKNGPVTPTIRRGVSYFTINSILKDYTPLDEDKPWKDPESLFCDGEFLEKLKNGEFVEENV